MHEVRVEVFAILSGGARGTPATPFWKVGSLPFTRRADEVLPRKPTHKVAGLCPSLP